MFLMSDATTQSLPCINVAKWLTSILDVYDLPGTILGESFDWMRLSKIPIFQKDLNLLVRSIGYYFDGCLLTITRKSTNRKRLFKGSFDCPDYSSEHSYNQFYFDDSRSSLVHGRGCIGHSVLIPKTHSDILPHSRELISDLNASFYRVDEYALVSQQNLKQLLSPRYNLSQIGVFPNSHQYEGHFSQTKCQQLLSHSILSSTVSQSKPTIDCRSPG
jgi:hypothetical protein